MSSEDNNVVKVIGDYQIRAVKNDYVAAWYINLINEGEWKGLLLLLPYVIYAFIRIIIGKNAEDRGCGVVITLRDIRTYDDWKTRKYKFTNDTEKDQKAVNKIIDNLTKDAERWIKEEKECQQKKEEEKRACCQKYKSVMEGVVGDEKKE